MKRMKNKMVAAVGVILLLAGCGKDNNTSTPDNYSGMSSFHATNGVQLQHYTVDAAAGGSFTSPQGTVVTIAPNSFKTQANGTVTGTVDIDFKDIYSKSDMLLSLTPTMFLGSYAPMKSGGEFFIKASQGGSGLVLTGTKAILLQQPLNGKPIDTAMVAMKGAKDTVATDRLWYIDGGDTVRKDPGSYVFALYHFTSPADSGTWCNSDNPSYFSAYPTTSLIMNLSDTSQHNTEVYLVFSGINSMVHVYGYSSFIYYYAPQGLSCTIVAVGTKGGKLYSSFTPITIGANQVVNFGMSVTTTSDFTSHLKQLDN